MQLPFPRMMASNHPFYTKEDHELSDSYYLLRHFGDDIWYLRSLGEEMTIDTEPLWATRITTMKQQAIKLRKPRAIPLLDQLYMRLWCAMAMKNVRQCEAYIDHIESRQTSYTQSLPLNLPNATTQQDENDNSTSNSSPSSPIS